MRAVLAVACLLVLAASAMPVAADDIQIKPVRCTPLHWRSMCTNGTASSIYGTTAAVAQFDVKDATGKLTIGSTNSFTVSWVKERVVEGENYAWKVHVTGTSAHGAVDLQGIWNPQVSIDMCTASIPAYCSAQAAGPIVLSGYAGEYSLELAGVALDTYSYTTMCIMCGPIGEDVRDALERVNHVVQQILDVRT